MIAHPVVAFGTLDVGLSMFAVGALLVALWVGLRISKIRDDLNDHLNDIRMAVGQLDPDAIQKLKDLLNNSGETIERLQTLSTDLRSMERRGSFWAVIYTIVGVILGIMAGVASAWIASGAGLSVLNAPFLKDRLPILRGLQVAGLASGLAVVVTLFLWLTRWVYGRLRKSDQRQVVQ